MIIELNPDDINKIIEINNFLISLSNMYPNIDEWFKQKVIPNIGISRKIVYIEKYDKIIAIGIAKDDGIEKKLCTIRISPEYNGKGYGLKLMDHLMEWLNTEKPLVTVSDYNLPVFDKIFNHYGFEYTKTINGLYVPDTSEHFFNDKG